LPTETVYGLAADAANAEAVAKLYEAKGRPRFNPLIAHVPDLASARKIGVMDERALQLARRFWPGPLTLVVPIADEEAVCDLARAGLDTVALRVPAHPVAREFLDLFHHRLLSLLYRIESRYRVTQPSRSSAVTVADVTGRNAQRIPQRSNSGR